MSSPTLRTLYLLVLLAVLGITPPVQSQSLYVQDPRQPWLYAQGTIEEAVLTVEPKGVYMENSLYLTFSGRAGAFEDTDTLEVVVYFNLPADAHVADSWLWFEDQILRAEIMDIWTASQIYEDIVRRRRDPSILYKRGQGYYELRIFPMPAKESRKVKITYLTPARWTAEAVTAPLPIDLLRASAHPVDMTVRAFTDAPWQGPRLVEAPELDFEPRENETLGRFHETTVAWEKLQQNGLTMAFDAPLENGLFVSKTTFDGEDWYQLALLPAEALDLAGRRKVAVLFDFDVDKTSVSESELVAAARSLLKTGFAPTDSFNVIVSRLDVRRLSEMWLPANPETVDATFDALGADPLADYSSLPALLADALAFIEEAGTGGSVLLITSSDQLGSSSVSNELIADLRDISEELPPIHIADLSNENVFYHTIGGRQYLGNEYLYTNLSRLSGGSYFALRSGGPLGELLATSFSSLRGRINAFDLYTTLENGFCYGRFSSITNDAVFLDQALVQVGKCYGSSAFVVEASGIYGEQPFSERLRLAEEETIPGDSTLAAYWTGQQIQLLEQEPPYNDIIAQIIDYSLDQRVLSYYTAFIALELSQGGEVCEDCTDGSGDGNPTGVEDETPSTGETKLTAYPNPFTTQVRLVVTFTEPVEAGSLTVRVYNTMGQLVKTLPVSAGGLVSDLELTWDGTNEAGQRVASGTYFIVVVTPTGRHTIAVTMVN